MRKNVAFLSVFWIFFSFSPLHSQVLDIATAKTKATGTQVTVRGIVLNGSELGLIKYIQDQTAGIAVYSSLASSLKAGDEVEITGTLKDYNNLLEIDPVSNLNLIGSNNPLPAPKILDFPEAFQEKYEAQFVRLNNISFISSGNFAEHTNYMILQNGVQKEIRIDKNTNIPGQSIPGDKIDVIGIMSQYKTTYQLLPRSMDDLILGSGPLINTPLDQSAITRNSFTVSFGTENPGNTMIKYGLTPNLELGIKKDQTLKTAHSILIDQLDHTSFYYIQALSANNDGDTSQSQVYLMSTASMSSGDIRVYFNASADKSYAHFVDAISLDRTADDTLAAYIARARESIDMAIYNFNPEYLSADLGLALNEAHSRGVRVRIVANGNTLNAGLNQLDPSIKVQKSPTSSSFGIMHNKFLIFDADASDPNKAIVWTGSMNLTTDQIHKDYNNIIIIQDQAVAKAYTIEFEEMWGSQGDNPNFSNAKWGPQKQDNTPHFFNVGGKLLEVYFSPSDQSNSKIIDAINQADNSIYFGLFVFTRTEIANPMIDKHNAGVYVSGIIGDIGGYNSAAWDVMEPVLKDQIINKSGSPIFHHKYAIIDPSDYRKDPVVISGSHNWSASANTKNDENLLIIHNDTIANIFFQEWAQRFAEAGGTVFLGRHSDEPEELPENTAAFFHADILKIRLEMKKAQDICIRLFDINGKEHYTTEYHGKAGDNIVEIHPCIKDRGIYLLRISSADMQETIKLFRY
jgi:phosphatidylserine/phosphatidylglycerophosphate/cardiolipin synthase-like enzyme/DNA/RNA endonuclease YhcR with UshA esterase domain